MDGGKNGWMDDRWMDGQMGRWKNGWMDGQMGGWKNGWMEETINQSNNFIMVNHS